MLSNYHTHTTFCDGKNSHEEIVLFAIEKGFNYTSAYDWGKRKWKDIKKIYLLKSGEYQLTFPLVPDSDGFSLGCDDSEIPYKISASLDPQKYLLYREDGKELHNDDCIPSNFIQNGWCFFILHLSNCFFRIKF